MTKTINTNPNSILAKLRNLARERYANLPANTMLLLYAQQGLLARLESSRLKEQFVLKGALSLFVRYDNAARPTEDIDLAANDLPNTVEAVRAAIAEVCAIPFEDGLIFDLSSISARVINEALTYSGVTITIQAVLGSSRAKVQLDVSFGNVITPEPIKLAFPVLLLPKPIGVWVYPLETVIAEKFAALVEIGETTTRMKDVYDLIMILTTREFEAGMVKQALTRSFKARGTPMTAVSVTLAEAFAQSPELTTRWKQYLNRTRFAAPEFMECMGLLTAFYHPLLLGNQTQGTWQPSQRSWIKHR